MTATYDVLGSKYGWFVIFRTEDDQHWDVFAETDSWVQAQRIADSLNAKEGPSSD